jgi:hypothetical protein
MLVTIYKDEARDVQAVKLASENPDEAQELLHIAERFTPKPEAPGSGSERWEHTGWTEAGDGTGYPGVPSQAQADAAGRADWTPDPPARA